jgi:undecaprenyl-phosphate 4-deoxy-4-formamido-L-arabinose transferase
MWSSIVTISGPNDHRPADSSPVSFHPAALACHPCRPGPDMDLSVVIPVYRSAPTLGKLLHGLLETLDRTGLDYEIIFVDDGSPDDSWGVLEQLRQEHPDRVAAIQLMRNYGQHNALMCGFRHSRGEYVVTMDDDLQHPPEEIPKLIEAIKHQDLDLVYGSYGGKKHSPWRNLSSWMVNAFYRTVFRSSITVTAFRIIRRPLLRSIFPYGLNFTFVDGLLAWNTQRIGEVAVEHRPRAQGRSGYSLGKLALLALNLFTNFSLLPLQVVSALGLLTAVFGLLLAVYYLSLYFLNAITVPGYASIIVAVLVLGGIQLMSLGVMGEYLGRLHLNVNRKPQYVERHVLGPESLPNQPRTRQDLDHSDLR